MTEVPGWRLQSEFISRPDMSSEYVLTMTALNRPGILAAVTRAMSELGGDLRELSQTVVQGCFTMIFSAEFPDELREEVIRTHIEDACRPFGIDVRLRAPAEDRSGESVEELPMIHTLRLGGENRPGVLQSLSAVIALKQADIVGMRAVRTRDSRGFEMVMKVTLPRELDIGTLVHALTEAGHDCGVTVDLIETP